MWPQFLNQLELTISCLCALTVWQASSLRTGEPGWMGGWMDGWMGGWVVGWMDGWIEVSEPLVGRQGSRVSMRVARGSA